MAATDAAEVGDVVASIKSADGASQLADVLQPDSTKDEKVNTSSTLDEQVHADFNLDSKVADGRDSAKAMENAEDAQKKSEKSGFRWFWQRDTPDSNGHPEKVESPESKSTDETATLSPTMGVSIADSGPSERSDGSSIENELKTPRAKQETENSRETQLEEAERLKFKWWWQKATPVNSRAAQSESATEEKDVKQGDTSVAAENSVMPTQDNTGLPEADISEPSEDIQGAHTASVDSGSSPTVVSEDEAEQMYVHEGYNTAVEIPAHMTEYCGRVFEGTMRSTLSKEPIYLRRWEPRDVEVRSLLFICHDHSSHCERYEQVIGGFLRQGTLVFSQDHEGHGHSAGQRADMYMYKTFVADVLKHVYTVKEHHKGLPLFGWGHGMGACILITAARKYSSVFAGLVLTSPMLRADPLANTRFKKALASTLSFFSPSLGVGQRLFAEDISDDPLEQKKWLADPLIYRGQVKIRWANCMLEAMDENCSHLSELETPFITMQGNENDVVLSDNAMFIYQNAKSTDKQLQYIDGGRHDLHACSQLIRRHVMETLYKWVEERSDGSTERDHHRLAGVDSFHLGSAAGLYTSTGTTSGICDDVIAAEVLDTAKGVASDTATVETEHQIPSPVEEVPEVEGIERVEDLATRASPTSVPRTEVAVDVTSPGQTATHALDDVKQPPEKSAVPSDKGGMSGKREDFLDPVPSKTKKVFKQMSQPLGRLDRIDQEDSILRSTVLEGEQVDNNKGRRRSNSRRHSYNEFTDIAAMVSINFDVEGWDPGENIPDATHEGAGDNDAKINTLRHASTQGEAQTTVGRRKSSSVGVRMSDTAQQGMGKGGVVLVFADESGIRYSRDTTVEKTEAETQQIYKHTEDKIDSK